MTLEELVVKISGDTSGLQSSFSKIGGFAGKAIAAASAAAAAGVATLAKSAIDSYADYEQLIGGVETLYKDSAGLLEEYANNAYKTAGLSANEYMETVTSFSASLLQSLGGDTEAAAKAADTALTDMADNANKMGTSMESIQNAYQGFAKQNYTMLDNLKLGYGGTKTEMERLLADAEAISGIEYNIDNLSDVYSAIHVIQTELGITGTTAKEAASTLSGSATMMKASWQNLLTGLADENADFETLINNLVESIAAFMENLMPRVEIALNGIAQLIEKLVPVIAEALPGLIESILPTLIDAITSLIESLIAAIPTLLPIVIEALTEIVFSVIEALIEIFPELITSIMECFTMIMDAISQNLPTLMTALVDGLIMLVQAIIDNLPMFLDSFLTLLLSFCEALVQAIPQIIEALPQLIEGILNFLIEALPQIIDAGIKLFVALIENLPVIIETIVAALPQIITAIIDALVKLLPEIIKAGVQLFTAIITNLPEIIVTIVGALPEIIMAIVEGIVGGIPSIVEAGGDLIKGLFQGIKDMGTWLYNKLSGWVNDVLGWIKGFFGIASPSKKMMEDGKFLVQGLSLGILSNTKYATDALHQLVYAMENSFNPNLDMPEFSTNFSFDRGSLEDLKESEAWTPSISLSGANLRVEEENRLQNTLISSNADIISTLVQNTRQLLEAIEEKDLSVVIGDEDIAASAARGNSSYRKRTGSPLFV